MSELKQKAIAAWSSGDYRSIATFIPPISAHLVRLVNISRDKSVLDVAPAGMEIQPLPLAEWVQV